VDIEPYYTLLEPRNLDSAWPRVAPWLMQAIGTEDKWGEIEEIRMGIARGMMQLWVIQDRKSGDLLAVAVTEVHQAGNVKSLVVRWMGGKDIKRWLTDLGLMERWGIINGCTKMEIWGRSGWTRWFSKVGYKEEFRVISKQLEQELH
jgi:hypothetical protein